MAAKWVLSDKGQRVFSQSKSDVFIVDPFGRIGSDRLIETLTSKCEDHGWKAEDILTAPSDKPGENHAMLDLRWGKK